MKNETRSTPETDAVYPPAIIDSEFATQCRNFGWGTLHDMRDCARKLERERNELREEIARMQTMVASVADIIAKRDAMLEAIREASVLIANCSGRACDAALQMHDDNDAKGVVDDVWLWSEKALAKLNPYLP